MITGVSHIGIAVGNLEEAVEALCDALGAARPEIREFPERKMRMALVSLGGIALELLEDSSDHGMIAEFVRVHGNGIHHLALSADDIDADLSALKGRGIDVIHDKPVMGMRGRKIAFLSPEAAAGITIELSEA